MAAYHFGSSTPEAHGKPSADGISIVDASGHLLPQVGAILAIIQSHDLILATGHISVAEVFAVANEALPWGIKTIITHPFARPAGPSMTMEEARQLTGMGAFIEFCFAACMPASMHMPAKDMVAHVKALGAEHCVLSTDFGQAHNPPPTEGFRTALATMLKFGLSERELELLVKTNPARLLGLAQTG